MSNPTETVAVWASRHPWSVIGAWAAIVVAALVAIVALLGSSLTTEANIAGNPESKRAGTLLEDRLRGTPPTREIILVVGDGLTVDDPEYQRFLVELGEMLDQLVPNAIAAYTSYADTPNDELVSDDRATTAVPILMAGRFDDASDHIESVLAIASAAGADPRFDVLQSGAASVGRDFQEIAEQDLRTGEVYGLIAALIILVLVFGALLAALIPVVLALVAIAVTVGLVAVLGTVAELSFFVVNMVVGMGLALGIDYSLLIVSRFREERSRGSGDRHAAIQVAGATANRAVLFSGAAFVLALIGMLFVPSTVLRSLGVGAILVGLVSVAAALTLLPAVLSVLGDRIEALSLGRLRRQLARGEAREGQFWAWAARLVMRRPLLSLLLAGGLLIAAAIPAFDLATGASGVSTLPDETITKRGFEVLDREFAAGRVAPFEVVVDGDLRTPAVREAVDELEETLREDARFESVTVSTNSGSDLTLLSAPFDGETVGQDAILALRELRAETIPELFEAAPAEVLVGGVTALNVDFFDATGRYRSVVFGFVLGLSFLLLMLAFRSVVVPAKAIAMNLLSVAAAYGLLVLVFQQGKGAGLFGFQQVDAVEAWIPLFMFSVLFALSMDYHVFLLSRIRERFVQTDDNDEAVEFGLRSTGRLITGAALIMVAVFSGIAAGRLVMFQQMGFGLAIALFLDATIVRSVLVPSSMKLLGRWNWYLPRWLEWLPDLGDYGETPPAGASAGED